MRRWLVVGATVLVAAACAGDPEPRVAETPDGLVVASFDFPESHLLAEIYAQALEDEGVEVRRELGLGQRELVMPALRAGLVDVVPEYVGSALDAAAPDSEVDLTDPSAPVWALRGAVSPWGISVLTPSRASNQNVIAVRAELAAAHDLRTVSDLAPHARSFTLGGPAECSARPRCLPGLEERYGLRFEEFVPLPGADLVRRALDDGVIDVGVLFSTDAALAQEGLVVLEDDRGLQPRDDVVPMVRTTALDDDRVRVALDEVSEELTTSGLRFLNWRLVHAGTEVAAEARGWLVRHRLVER